MVILYHIIVLKSIKNSHIRHEYLRCCRSCIHFQNFVCHICYFGDFAEAVESNFAVDPLIAFRGAVFVPAGFNEAGGDGVYADLLGFQFFDQGFGKKMDGGFGYSVDQRGGVSLLSGVGACEQDTAAFSYDGAEFFTRNTGTDRLVFTILLHSSKV